MSDQLRPADSSSAANVLTAVAVAQLLFAAGYAAVGPQQALTPILVLTGVAVLVAGMLLRRKATGEDHR